MKFTFKLPLESDSRQTCQSDLGPCAVLLDANGKIVADTLNAEYLVLATG